MSYINTNNINYDDINNHLYIYTNTNTILENDIEVTYTNFFIVLYKYKFFFSHNDNCFTKLNVTKEESKVQDKVIVAKVQDIVVDDIVDNMSQLNISTTEENANDLKTTLLNTLNNKITIKILKESIMLINSTLNKNIKTTGTKEVLIERVNEILKTLA